MVFIHSKIILPNKNEGVYVINLDQYKSIGTHGITLYVNGSYVTYFDRFKFFYGCKKVFISLLISIYLLINKFIITENNKFSKFKIPKMQYILNKTLVLFNICNECGSNKEKTCPF